MANRQMAVRFVPWTPTTPAGTLASAPQSQDPGLGGVMLLGVRIRIPPGHAGTTGLRIDYAGATIVPFSNPASWIVGDDDRHDLDVGFAVGNGLRVVTFNTDVFDHSHLLLFRVTDVVIGPEPVQLLDITPSAVG